MSNQNVDEIKTLRRKLRAIRADNAGLRSSDAKSCEMYEKARRAKKDAKRDARREVMASSTVIALAVKAQTAEARLRVIAALLESGQAWRIAKALDDPPPPPIVTPEVYIALGRRTDKSLGKSIGVHASTVRAWRRELGIPAFNAPRKR
jgi:hypothetical protein